MNMMGQYDLEQDVDYEAKYRRDLHRMDANTMLDTPLIGAFGDLDFTDA
jgi:hypothetical protein